MWLKCIFLYAIIFCGGQMICKAGPTSLRLIRRNVHELHIPVAIVSGDDNYNSNVNDINKNKEINQYYEENRATLKNLIDTIDTIDTKDQTQTSLLVEDVTKTVNDNDKDNFDNSKKRLDNANDVDDDAVQSEIVKQNDGENFENVKNSFKLIEQNNDEQEKLKEETYENKLKSGEDEKREEIKEQLVDLINNDKDINKDTQNTLAQKILDEKKFEELNKEITAGQDELKDELKEDKDINGKLNENVNEKDIVLRQSSSDNAPVSTTTQANFVQQLIQNSPLGPIFNQFTGQQNQNDAGTTSPPSPLQPFLNPLQTVVNSTTQAFQGFQQFANNIGQQFQNTLSSLGGQQSSQSDSTTQRPPGPIQQLVTNFIGGGQNAPNDQQQQPQPQQQGPLQTLFTNIFQGGQRPQNANTPAAASNSVTTSAPIDNSQPQIVEENDEDSSNNRNPQIAVDNNQLRNSDEIEDSFEQNMKSDEQIVVDDDDQQEVDREQTHSAANTIA